MSDSLLIFLTYTVLIGTFIAFIRERTPTHLVALTAMCILLVVGAIETEDMLGVFSNSAPITIACMFIISAALDQTGVIDLMGRILLNLSSRNKYLCLIATVVFVVTVSAFMNNTPVVIILTPVIIALAEKLKDYPSKYLIPLSYIAILGGTCTLIGTSTNILVNGVAIEHGQPAIGMFEITGAGLLLTLTGLIYIALIGRHLLPSHYPPKVDFADDTPQKRFLSEAIIPVDSPLIGKSLNEVKFTDNEDYEIIDLIRMENSSRMKQESEVVSHSSLLHRLFGSSKTAEPVKVEPEIPAITSFRDMKIKAGDRLVFKLDKDEIVELSKNIGIEFDPKKSHLSEPLPTREIKVEEGFLPPTSNFIGLRIKDLRLRRAYGCFVIGLHRKEKNFAGYLPNTVLKEGDSLILEGAPQDMERLFNNEDILSASSIRKNELDKPKASISIGIIIAIVTLSALGIMPIAGLAMIGAVLVIMLGCVSPERAYHSIEWRILLLIFGMLAIGAAMSNTGAANLLVDQTVKLFDGFGPLFLLAMVYLLTWILTEMVTNNAVAILVTPIVIELSTSLGYDARPFIITVMFAASASFATPIGYQTNTFVYAAGGYKFKDFMKVGIPMNLIMLVAAVFIIPMFWSF